MRDFRVMQLAPMWHEIKFLVLLVELMIHILEVGMLDGAHMRSWTARVNGASRC